MGVTTLGAVGRHQTITAVGEATCGILCFIADLESKGRDVKVLNHWSDRLWKLGASFNALPAAARPNEAVMGGLRGLSHGCTGVSHLLCCSAAIGDPRGVRIEVQAKALAGNAHGNLLRLATEVASELREWVLETLRPLLDEAQS